MDKDNVNRKQDRKRGKGDLSSAEERIELEKKERGRRENTMITDLKPAIKKRKSQAKRNNGAAEN